MNRALASSVLFSGLLHRAADPRVFLPLPPGHTATAAPALFHSTPVLQRRRNSRYRFNSYATRFRGKDAKKAWLRDASIYLERLLQGHQDVSSSESNNYASWFEKQYFSKYKSRGDFHTQEYQRESNTSKKRRPVKVFWTDSDSDSDSEVDTIFGSAFGGQNVYGSCREKVFNWRYSRYRNEHSWEWKDESRNYNDAMENSSLTSDRAALGLTISGPLKLDEVKKAYRACALKWHPDRHQGSTKAFAEEKFKHCTAAYKAICDNLAPAQT